MFSSAVGRECYAANSRIVRATAIEMKTIAAPSDGLAVAAQLPRRGTAHVA
jgi:hypothetical protein